MPMRDQSFDALVQRLRTPVFQLERNLAEWLHPKERVSCCASILAEFSKEECPTGAPLEDVMRSVAGLSSRMSCFCKLLGSLKRGAGKDSDEEAMRRPERPRMRGVVCAIAEHAMTNRRKIDWKKRDMLFVQSKSLKDFDAS